MAHWLVKQEPTSYSWSKLVRDRRTRWDGVHNAQALIHLRSMRPGDEAFFYHSGEERSAVGILRIVTMPVADARDPRRSWYVEVEPVRPLARPISIGEVRTDPALKGIELLRNSRLSVMPIPDAMWSRILALSEKAPTNSVRRPAVSRRRRTSAGSPRTRRR